MLYERTILNRSHASRYRSVRIHINNIKLRILDMPRADCQMCQGEGFIYIADYPDENGNHEQSFKKCPCTKSGWEE